MPKLSALPNNNNPSFSDKLVNVQSSGPTDSLTTVAQLQQLLFPAGLVMETAATTAPTGWLVCDGSPVNRTTYAALFGAVGTSFGAGDGSTTFNLPDMRGRVAVGVGTASGAAGATAHSLGQKAGEETHQLVTGEMPSHTHNDTGHTHSGASAYQYIMNASGGAVGYASGPNGLNAANTTLTDYAHLSNTGGDGAHNNMQPYVGLNYIIKT